MEKLTTKPLPRPAPVAASPESVNVGQLIPPIERIRIFSSRQWEEFILEWADSLRTQYKKVERCGGAGDKGRDVVATAADGTWDNFQCKHYDAPLAPSDIWVELGKLIHYSRAGAFTLPRRYFFVAPQGAGTKLSNLLRRPEQLRSELLGNWDKHCKKGITSTSEVCLDDGLRAYIMAMDFSIFEAIPPLRIIDEHRKTPWYVSRFGGGLPERPRLEDPPAELAPSETRYVRQLLDAYGDHLKRPLSSPDDIADSDLKAHFGDSRIEFYSAEALRAFSRDTVPPGTFEDLQEEIHSGISDEVRAHHSTAYARVLAVVKLAKTVQITANALISRLTTRDRGGICHQLANDDKVRWK